MRRILGVDPGSGSTGYGIIESDGSHHSAVVYGAVRSTARLPFPARLLKIYAELNRVLDSDCVQAMAVEEVFHAANVQSALKLGHVRGIVILAAAQHSVPVFEYSPLEIKNAVVGYGRAEKAQVQSMVRFLLCLSAPPTPCDAADALAIAICHSHHAFAADCLSAAEAQR